MRPLFIVTLKDRIASIEYAIGRFIHPKAAYAVKVFGFELVQDLNRMTRDISYEATKFIKDIKKSECSILIDTEVKCYLSDLSRLHSDVEKKPFSKLVDIKFRRATKPFLLKILDRYGVSKITYAQFLASNWSHFQVGDDRIDRWLNQFELIGYPWLGEILISNMYVMSSSELSDIFYKSIEVKADDIFCVSRDPTIYGKSGEVISNLLRKRFECKKILDDPTSFFEQENNGKLHIFEDGLWTGTEAIGILESILGRRKNTVKHEKIRALSNPSLLYNYSVVLHYSMACDYGFKLLNRFLECEGLTNIIVSVPENNYLPVLTEFGGQYISECIDIKDLLNNGPPNNVIRPWIFRDSSIWGGQDRMIIAQRVLQHLGAQLFTRYIERQIALLGWKMWPSEKIEKCALGCWNAGLAFGFSHSIPKATLPVFWSGGDVEISEKKLNWVPLFYNAD